MNLNNFRLQYITHYNASTSYVDGALQALQGGCRWVQLRMKDASDDEVRQAASLIMPKCRELGATFIIDDRVQLVKELGADGVHLGKNDMPVSEARTILGQGFIIGGTANTFDDIEMHYQGTADYVGCGPFRFTTTKKKLAAILGLEGYRSLIEQMKTEGIGIPVVAIGGITEADIPAIMTTGVSGIAMSGTILNACDAASTTASIIKTINNNIK